MANARNESNTQSPITRASYERVAALVKQAEHKHTPGRQFPEFCMRCGGHETVHPT